MHKDILKIPSFFQCRKIAKWIRLRFKNHFSQLETTKKLIFLHQELLKKKRKSEKIFSENIVVKVSGLRSPLCLQNVSFLEKSRTNFGYRIMGHWEKEHFKTKKYFEKSHKVEKFWKFKLLQNIKKLATDPPETIRNFQKTSNHDKTSIKSFRQVRYLTPRPSVSQTSKNPALDVTNY